MSIPRNDGYSKATQFMVAHWLTIANLLVILFILPIVLYPLFMATGVPLLQDTAGVIKFLYHFICHQFPRRSLFVLGYQMAVDARSFALYVAFLAGGIAFGRARRKLKPLPLWLYGLFMLPIAVDGFSQLFGVPMPRGIGPGWQLLWTVESNNVLRVITGSIFGLASALYIYPRVQEVRDATEEYGNALKQSAAAAAGFSRTMQQSHSRCRQEWDSWPIFAMIVSVSLTSVKSTTSTCSRNAAISSIDMSFKITGSPESPITLMRRSTPFSLRARSVLPAEISSWLFPQTSRYLIIGWAIVLLMILHSPTSWFTPTRTMQRPAGCTRGIPPATSTPPRMDTAKAASEPLKETKYSPIARGSCSLPGRMVKTDVPVLSKHFMSFRWEIDPLSTCLRYTLS